MTFDRPQWLTWIVLARQRRRQRDFYFDSNWSMYCRCFQMKSAGTARNGCGRPDRRNGICAGLEWPLSLAARSPCAAKQRSQGGVKFPTGGIWICLSACVQQPASARLAARPAGVSRSGEMPEPTVTVRMKEIAQHLHGRRHAHGCPMGCAAPCGAMARALIHLSHLERAP